MYPFKNNGVSKTIGYLISKSKKIRAKKKRNVKIYFSKKEYDINYKIFILIGF
jgi:hypothetical protein